MVLLKAITRPLSKAISKAFMGASDNFASKAAKWATTAGKDTVEQSPEVADAIVQKLMKEFDEVRHLGEKAGANVTKLVDEGNKELYNSMKSLRSEIIADKAEIQRLTRTINPMKKLEPDMIDRGAKERAELMLADLKNKVIANDESMRYLGDAWEKSNAGYVHEAMESLKEVNIPMAHPGVQGAVGKYQKAFNLTKHIANQTAKGSDTAFIKQYVALKRSPAASRKLELWLANPKNNARINKLMRKDRLADLMTGTKMTKREKIMGATLSDTAKRLGLSGAAMVGGLGLLKVYNWFGGNSPSKISSQSVSAFSGINSLNVSGYAKSIVNEAKSSAAKISQLSFPDNLTAGSAESAIQSYISVTAKEVNDIQKSLSQWQTVIDSSENKELARSIGSNIKAFADGTANSITRLAKGLGVNVSLESSVNVPTNQGVMSEEANKIQNLLGLQETGAFNKQTVNMLKSLEQQFNQKADSKEFTGAFAKNDGSFATYDELLQAFNRINDY